MANTVKKTEKLGEKLYRQLVHLVETVLAQVQIVETWLRRRGGKRALALVELLAQYVPLVRQVIQQTTHRVFQHKSVSAPEKIVSLFEPHTAIIQRGKVPPHETEFGRKLWYSKVDSGIVSEYRLLDGNPPDDAHWEPSLNYHRKLFGHPPDLATADRGVFSKTNEQAAHQLGVKHVALPQPGEDRSAETPESPAVVQSGVTISRRH